MATQTRTKKNEDMPASKAGLLCLLIMELIGEVIDGDEFGDDGEELNPEEDPEAEQQEPGGSDTQNKYTSTSDAPNQNQA